MNWLLYIMLPSSTSLQPTSRQLGGNQPSLEDITFMPIRRIMPVFVLSMCLLLETNTFYQKMMSPWAGVFGSGTCLGRFDGRPKIPALRIHCHHGCEDRPYPFRHVHVRVLCL